MADEIPAVDEGTEAAEASTDETLGDAGKKALGAERQARNAAERETKAAQRQVTELAKQLKAYEDRDKSDLEKANERLLNAEARVSAIRERAVSAEIKARAANTFADPSDAAAFLRASDYVDDQGEIDEKALDKAISDLLKAKPHLAKEGAPPSFDGGARRTADKPPSMNDLIRQKAGLG